MDNQIFENEETFNILQYVKENLSGLFLLALVFFIIYFVDYINRLNTIIYSAQSPIPSLTSVINTNQKISKRKIKKR